MMIQEKIKNFSFEIYTMIKNHDMDFIDAVVHWCDVNSVDVEFAASLVKTDPNILHEIQLDAESLNYLKRTARLPI
jgi:hypothetical protein